MYACMYVHNRFTIEIDNFTLAHAVHDAIAMEIEVEDLEDARTSPDVWKTVS